MADACSKRVRPSIKADACSAIGGDVPPPFIYKDSSTDCAICLCPLEEEGVKVIELTCGHRWHSECLKEQLQHSQPSHSKRLLFNGCQCAKCGLFCDHQELDHLTRKIDGLREKVSKLIVDQLQVDACDAWKRSESDPKERSDLMRQAQRNYAFYLCSNCKDPYFGGNIECADQEEGELAPQDRLCVACSPQSQTICEQPLQHRSHLIWKCRYCCQPSSFLCYGSVHFCDSCHERNSHRLKERQRGSRNSPAPPSLEPLACPGDSCSFPKPVGQTSHKNGQSSTCEQVYHCAWCDSSSSEQNRANQVPPGTLNLLANPSGEMGLSQWAQMNPRVSWQVENCDVPPNENVTTNFVSSYQWCVMAQGVQLNRIAHDPSQLRLEVSAKYMSRTDCPSVFRMEVVVLDRRRTPIHRETTPVLEAPLDFWGRSVLTVEPTEGAHEIIVIVHGKDKRFWQGNFGSKVSDICVRILGTDETLDQQLIEPNTYRNEATARNLQDNVGEPRQHV